MNKINPEFLINLKRQIKSDEGFRRKPYDDKTGQALHQVSLVAGTITFGYGFTFLEKDEADAVLQIKLRKIIEADLLLFSEIGNLNEARLIVYVSMLYQLGVAGLKGFKKFRKAVKSKDWELACKEMLESKWAQQDSPNRAIRLMNIMATGKL